ncbi:helix-turn-helix domain-containing protein [Actinophytocola sp.]|uniref:helix-turn-helix domain-containing protein n=1 Tax=Actinophytocola sp. TaxID=1872138 RepID=UPI002EDADF2D
MRASRTPVDRVEFATRDRDEAAEFIRQVYCGYRPRFGNERANTEFRVRSGTNAELAADRVRLSMNFGVTAEPVDQLIFGVMGRGRMRLAADDGEERNVVRGDSFLYRPAVATDVEWHDIEVGVVRLPVAPVAELAEQQAGIDGADLRFESMVPVSAAMARHWRCVTGLVSQELLTPDSAMSNPLVAEQLLRTVAAAALATFPNTAMIADHVPGPGRVAPAALRRAVAFIEAHATEPIRLAQVAAAAGVGVRALQYGFVRHYGTSPTGFLQHVRLERAHGDLQAADPTRGDTVAAIAARWGFAKPGRFSVRYRERYGRPPSQTLRT